MNVIKRKNVSCLTNKTFTQRLIKKKLKVSEKKIIFEKNFFNRRRNAIVNKRLNEFNKREEKEKIIFLRKKEEILFQSPLNKKINQKAENLIEQSVIKRVFNKESMMYETQKIKSDLIKRANTKIDILFLYIKDGNHQNFKDIFQKFNPGIEEKDEKGNSFLNLSVQCCCKEIIEFLIDKGANINSQNKKLNTPLHYALSYQNYDIADLLLRFGADENIKNIDGLTPWQCLKYEHSIE